MAKPIAFGTYQFKTKKNATEEARRRINQYEAGDRLQLEDELFFTSLFTLHSEYAEKKGPGIDYIQVERDFHQNRCLYIYRVDGTSTDCSWVHCIQPASHKTIVSMAFRRAVKDIVMRYKTAKLVDVDVCPILGIKLTYDNSHASYFTPSFDELLSEFLNQGQIDIESVKLTNPEPNDLDQRGILTDPELLERWITYHINNAHLQLLSAEANLRRLKS
ncbi:DCL family protein [Marinobacter sp. M3C]|uniref:DCL family protein n=1 Tax=Marinobacter sp. M3C TaxID=2917715 RepID=UPI00200CBDA3|nr:DCL family protein [Marinobacter sp. M3C]UQG61434.1 DCL family protein [Marinobacter sp. M3C]